MLSLLQITSRSLAGVEKSKVCCIWCSVSRTSTK